MNYIFPAVCSLIVIVTFFSIPWFAYSSKSFVKTPATATFKRTFYVAQMTVSCALISTAAVASAITLMTFIRVLITLLSLSL